VRWLRGRAEVGVRCEHRIADFEEQKYPPELGTVISDWLIFERCHSCKRDEVLCYWRRGGGLSALEGWGSSDAVPAQKVADKCAF
jgi:hypothetical protein